MFSSLLQEYGAVNDSNKLSNFLSIGQASDYLGVSIDTLRRWEKRGRITPYRSPGGHRYYKKQELDGLFGKRYTHDKTVSTEGIYTTETIDEIEEPKTVKPLLVVEEDIPPTFSTNEIKIPEVQMIAIGRNQSRFSQFAGIQSTLRQSSNVALPSHHDAPTILIPQASANKKAETTTTRSPSTFQQYMDSIISSKDLIKNVALVVIMIFVLILGAVFLIMFWRSSQSVLSPSP